jgi:transposase-like protein
MRVGGHGKRIVHLAISRGSSGAERWVADRNTPRKLVWRARIVLMWAEGVGVGAIVRATGKTKRTAYRWRDRYVERGLQD